MRENQRIDRKRRNSRRRKQQYNRRVILLLVLTAIVAFILGAKTISADAHSQEKRYKYYTTVQVHAGDSLWKIGSEYITDDYKNIDQYIAEVKKINKLSSSYLKTGQYLCVPYYSSEVK